MNKNFNIHDKAEAVISLMAKAEAAMQLAQDMLDAAKREAAPLIVQLLEDADAQLDTLPDYHLNAMQSAQYLLEEIRIVADKAEPLNEWIRDLDFGTKLRKFISRF